MSMIFNLFLKQIKLEVQIALTAYNSVITTNFVDNHHLRSFL